MKTSPFRSDTSLFWLLQITGWFLYGAMHILNSSISRGWGSYQVIRFSTSSFSAFLVTLVLRQLYKKSNYQTRSIFFIAFIAFFYSFLASNFLVWIANILRVPFWGPQETLVGNFTWGVYVEKVFWWLMPFTGWSALYFGIKFLQNWQQQKARTEKAHALAQTAQLQMLRYRINPHFLFNSLNSIRALIGENRKSAKELVTELSEVLRYSLLSKNYRDVPLKNEIEALQHYFAVEKIRYENKLEVTYEIGQEAWDFPVLSFLLHPLAENAIRYGMQTSEMPLRIKLQAKVVNDELQLNLSNSGSWIEPSLDQNGLSLGKGLDYVRQRLNDDLPDLHSFQIKEEAGAVHADIRIFSGTQIKKDMRNP